MSFLGRTPSNAPLTTADIPDGIIVAADLAPNSVDSSELVDGSIDTSHLSSSLTLTTPNLGTPSAGVVTNLSGVLPVGVTGGSGLDAVSAGITHASQWRLPDSFSGSAEVIGATGGASGDWEETDAPAGFGILGASMTETDGIFSFPATGFWHITWKIRGFGQIGTDPSRMEGRIYTTHDYSGGSGTWEDAAGCEVWIVLGSYETASCDYILDVTSTTTFRVRFRIGQGDSSAQTYGHSYQTSTSATFINLAGT